MRKPTSFPTHIQIQTTTYCGSRCAVCPNEAIKKTRTQGFMNWDLFKKIVDECSRYTKEIDRIIPYLQADPLRDNRIFEMLNYIKEKMPGICIEFSTTWDKIQPDLFSALLNSPITELRVSSYGITGETYKKFMPGVDYNRAIRNIDMFLEEYNKEKPFRLLLVTVRNLLSKKQHSINKNFWATRGVELLEWDVTSRAGKIVLNDYLRPNKLSNFLKKKIKPFVRRIKYKQFRGNWCNNNRDINWIHILFNGDVCLCCMDYNRDVILGNVKDMTLKEIWTGEKYNKIRQTIANTKNIPDSFICKKCEYYCP